MRASLLLAAVCGVLAATSARAQSPAAGTGAAEADAVLATATVKTGLCIDLGCGRADMGGPGLAAGIASRSAMLVHALALDDAALARTREAIATAGVPGRAMAERLVGKTLPYLPDLARLVVVEDPDALASAGVAEDEVLRVLAPGGTLCVRRAGKWVATIKPRPTQMDEWTHPHHGPDGNLVSADKAISFPISLRWIDGLPATRGGFGDCASCRAVVLAGGRCFTVSVNDLANLSAPATSQPAYLMARDAYSGLPLWKISCQATYSKVQLDWRNVWPLVATDRRVYTARRDSLVILDAASGKVETTCPTQYQPKRLLLLGGVLVAACWEKVESKGGYEGDTIRSVWWPAGGGSVEAFDAETGKPQWTLPLTALEMVASDGVVYLLTHKGNPPTERQIVAVELATGKEKWRVPHTVFGEEPDIYLGPAGPGCAVVSKTKVKGDRGVWVLSAADGKALFTIPGATARCIVGGELWCADARYDLASGRKLPGAGVGAPHASGNGLGGCVPPIVVGGRYVTGSRGGIYVQLPEGPGQPPTRFSYQGARGACIQGMVPANGMFYTAQNHCACYMAQVGGFLAVGPCGDVPKADEFEQPRPVEKGPAFEAIEPPRPGGAPSADDWPTYRHDAERSAGTASPASMPDALKVLWRASCARPGDGLPAPFAEAWSARMGFAQPLTAPVVAGGMVFVAGVDTGQVLALNPDTGATIWRALLGSRIDTPPTIHRGLCLVGCHDGWVYALRAKDGALAYRMRVAPRERRIVAHGLVESVWPATGAVLVYDDVAYVTAGRSTESDGGIALVAFKPQTGETLWTKALGEKLVLLNDVLSVQKGELAWHWLRFEPKTGGPLPPVQRLAYHGSMLDGSWLAGFGPRHGRGFMLGRAAASMMVWNDRMVVSPSFAVDRARVEVPKPPANSAARHPDAFKRDELLWRLELEPHIEWARVYAMALAGDAVFFAGSVFNGWAAGRYDGSFLWIKSADSGRRHQPTIKLDCPPAYDGLAAAGQRVYLSLRDGTLMCLGQ